jgi:2-oxoglutarate dehydrogenase E1 component
MAHRGRLNFLTKLCGEDYSSILGQFAGNSYIDEQIGNSGDVKYHLGSSKICHFSGCEDSIEVLLMPNPSHLEAVNGPVLGRTRALQDCLISKDFVGGDDAISKKKVVPFLIHGDASFVGQGVVYECLAMNNLDGYDVGGCVHLIIDNQIGFTANASETRPSKYASDVAKTLDAPIFHLNGDHPESAVFLAKLCARVRQEFSGDIVVNLVCYRRFGHNEGDEPLFTQPLMYKKISEKKTVYEMFKEKLSKSGLVSIQEFEKKELEFEKFLSNELEAFRAKQGSEILDKNWSNHELVFSTQSLRISLKTGLKKEFISENVLKTLKDASNHVKINEKLKKLVLESRIKSLEAGLLTLDEKILDWGLCEMLAFCGILNDGKSVRISGEDVVRGTFSHRHAAFVDSETEEKYFYYESLANGDAKLTVSNSLLSEYGVMGFEFGYSTLKSDNLVIWEAQFGDFVNCAQVVIDQYLSASEQKWLKISNLVLMLPHGYEGQGPEHSSARIERFLQLAGEFNMRVVQPTTPANLFHILRAQVHEETLKKPLIIFTPKSLLRHRLVKSSMNEILNDSFRSILFDQNILKEGPSEVKKIILCSGKIYYEIFEKLEEAKRKDVFLIRIECFYPFPIKEISEILFKFDLSKIELVWAQDEPKNMGAFTFVLNYIGEFFADEKNILNQSWKNFNAFKDLKFVGRDASASTATGSQYVHQKEQRVILEKCLD